MGYIHHAKNFQFWSSGSGDMGLNNLHQGPPRNSQSHIPYMLGFQYFLVITFSGAYFI